MKQIINITDIVEYLYCPRKVYLKLIEKVKFPPNRQMILGSLRHKIFDIFNKNEASLVSSIKTKLNAEEIKNLYENLLTNIVKETSLINSSLMQKFSIKEDELSASIRETAEPEINLRIESIINTLNLGFLGKELWHNLKPKYLTEFKLESVELGLKGRIDRVKFEQEIIPYEIKTRRQKKGVFYSDKIQLAAYALLLENEFNKKVEKGKVEILGKQEEVELSNELKNKVLELAEEIRNLEKGEMPNNFKKCRYCVYNKICIED